MDGRWGQAAVPALPQITRRGKGCHALRVPPPRPRLMLTLARGSCAAPAPLLVHRRWDPLGPTGCPIGQMPAAFSAFPLPTSTLRPNPAALLALWSTHAALYRYLSAGTAQASSHRPSAPGATRSWRTGAVLPRTTSVPSAGPVSIVANTHSPFVNATVSMASSYPVRRRTRGSVHPTAPLVGAHTRSVTSAGVCPGAHHPAGPGSLLRPHRWRLRDVPWGPGRPAGQRPKQPRPPRGQTRASTMWRSGSQRPLARTPFTVKLAAFT